jgi:hypothetical protein
MEKNPASQLIEWVLVIDAADLISLSSVRTLPGLCVASVGTEIWLRLPGTTLPLADSVKRLPTTKTFKLDGQRRLFAPKGLTPIGKLPDGNWIPILEFLPLEPPVSAFAGRVREVMEIALVPSEKMAEVSGLRCKRADFQAWAESVSALRIHAVRFAAAASGVVFVLGDLLPPIPGRAFWKREGLLLPAGFDLEFPLLAPMIAARCNPNGEGVVVMEADGRWECIDSKLFVVATRSGIRQTQPTSK